MTYKYYKQNWTDGNHVNCSNLMKHMCQSSLDAIVIYDDTGKISGINGGAEHVFDYAEQELLGQSVNLILPTLDYKTRNRDYLTQMTTASRSDGTTFPVEMMLTEFTNGLRRYFLVIIRDLASGDSHGYSSLSPRQRQVLKLVVQGFTSREIAKQLTISIKTVETHRANIMTKLGVRNVSSLVRFAVENDII